MTMNAPTVDRILFCNIGWMERYHGQQKGTDEITGGGKYVHDHGRGDEICNFVPVRGKLFGWVQPAGEQIALERIGDTPDDDKLSGVTVVWTAKRKGAGTVVVGWYRNATVFRKKQKQPSPSSLHRKNKITQYRITAPAKDAVLLPVDERTCEIPRQKKGSMGQANVWYADSTLSRTIVNKVIDLIGGKRATKPVRSLHSQKQDQERKALVEKAAIRRCCDHFENLGYVVKSVEKDNVGWDLEAQLGKIKLRIEVKGLSGSNFAVELTPNEFKAFSEISETYRLAIVRDALVTPRLCICRHSQENDEWLVEGDDTGFLHVTEKISATITLG